MTVRRDVVAVGCGAALLAAALASAGAFGGWRAEAAAASASRTTDPLAAVDLRARAVAANPLLPRHRRELDRALEVALRTAGASAVEQHAPVEPVPRSRFAVALAGANAGGAITRVALGAVPRDRLELETLDRESLVLAARSLASSGRCAESMPIFDAFAARSATTKRIDLDVGRCRLELGEPALALPSLERARAAEPESRWPRLALAEAHLALGRIAEADAESEALVREIPDFYHGWYARGRVLLRAGRGPEAKHALERAVELAERSEDPFWLRYQLAEAKLASGEARSAAEDASTLTKERPGIGAAWALHGRALLEAGSAAEARASLERAIELGVGDDESPWPRFQLASALFASGAGGRALAETTALVARHPELSAVWTLHGRVLLAAEKPSQAVSAFERALALHPERAKPLWPQIHLADALLTSGALDRAEPISARLVAENPRFYYAWHLRGRVLEALGRPGEAAAAFRSALALRPANHWLEPRIEALEARASGARSSAATAKETATKVVAGERSGPP